VLDACLVIATVLIVVVFDQASKAVVCRRLTLNASQRLGRALRVTRAENRGSAWLELSTTQACILWCTTAALVLVLCAAAPVGSTSAIGLGLALGGACGNLVDRVVRNAVVDFIGVARWPLFNVADVALTTGVLITPLGLL
jgi:signal peptidase II